MLEYTDFGRNVKKVLLGPPVRTQKWLCNEVKRDTGLFVDSAYMYKILTGQRNAPKIKESICKILKIDYISEKEKSPPGAG